MLARYLEATQLHEYLKYFPPKPLPYNTLSRDFRRNIFSVNDLENPRRRLIGCWGHARNYRASAKDRQIVVHERVGPDVDELLAHIQGLDRLIPGAAERLRAGQDRDARFTPVLRFILVDEERRTFRAERRCYLGNIDDWIDIGAPGRLQKLARDLIPKLGTERFFEVY
jgi:hypothetical protein